MIATTGSRTRTVDACAPLAGDPLHSTQNDAAPNHVKDVQRRDRLAAAIDTRAGQRSSEE